MRIFFKFTKHVPLITKLLYYKSLKSIFINKKTIPLHFLSVLKKVILLYYLLALLCLNVLAQQPSYYIIGEEELSGVDIYSIAQSENGIIYLSTNEGLIKYNGYEYISIPSNETKSNSLFGLKKDNNGDLFCNNLSGQIFKIKNDSLLLFYELPDSLISSFFNFNFDNENCLVFCTENYYQLDKNFNIKLLLVRNYDSINIPKTKNGELILSDRINNKNFFYKDGNIEYIKNPKFHVTNTNIRSTLNTTYFSGFNTSKPVVYYKKGTWKKIEFENEKEVLAGGMTDFYPLDDSLFAIFFKTKGAFFYNQNGTLKYSKSRLFTKYRISGALKDSEGNIWLTTLGKGIIIIPNTNVVDYNNHPLFNEDDLKAITSDEDGNVYIAGLKGIIYKIKGSEVKILKENDLAIEFLEFYPEINAIFFERTLRNLDHGKEQLMQLSSTKDIAIVDSAHFYIATNIGLVSAFINKKQAGIIETTYLTKLRTYCVTYDKKNKEIWAGTSKGLQILSGNQLQFILYNNQRISATDLEYINDEVWVSTLNNGILIFKDGKFSHLFSYTAQNKINAVKKLEVIDSRLFFTTNDGLIIYNFKNKQLKKISKRDGLLSHRILDFELVNDTVWLIFTNGLQRFPLNSIIKNSVPPTIFWKNILVNGKSILQDSVKAFDYLQNQFEFHFLATAFRHRGRMIYKYKLEGLDGTWQEKPFENNSVKYQSLPYGAYTFKAKAINEHGIESKIISYSFEINPPFWLTWWFYILCGLGLVSIVAVYFIIRLNIVRKRLTLEKQLKMSEITAIKAQMNPHFVFNALNSIQDLVMLRDIRNSNIYLGKFADLMRKILAYSSKNFISLTDETELLQLYLELEKLRFGDEFNATIHCEIDENQLDEIQIPSMIIQPYAENAIKHGLLHKEGFKELKIIFSFENETLTCEIIDNGIGREKSAEIKQRREKNHVSFSSKANKKRIDLIKESTNKNISLEIIDLKESEKAIGTKVVLKFS